MDACTRRTAVSTYNHRFAATYPRLERWLTAHEDALFDALDTHLIAFGEWCTAKHSLDYAALPDWWLAFDVYDRREALLVHPPPRRLGARARPDNGTHVVSRPNRSASLEGPAERTAQSIRDGPMEGMVIRVDHDRWLHHRTKLVRPDFTQQIDKHWRSNALVWNHLEPTT